MPIILWGMMPFLVLVAYTLGFKHGRGQRVEYAAPKYFDLGATGGDVADQSLRETSEV